MKVSEHCFALTGFEDYVNAGFVVGSRGIAVIDTTMFPYSAASLLGYARCVCPDLPVAVAFNTHWHADHVFGNQVFRQAGASIIVHRLTRTALENLPDYPKLCLERAGNVYATSLFNGINLTLPDEWFDDEHRIDLASRSLLGTSPATRGRISSSRCPKIGRSSAETWCTTTCRPT